MAATFRVEKTKGYTVMSNYHLRDKSLSLKARGLLSYILSLPEDWDYTIVGLSKASGASKGTIESTLKELEKAGYIERTRIRNEDGTLSGTEYIIREQPEEAKKEPEKTVAARRKKKAAPSKNGETKPFSPKPKNPDLDNPVLDNQEQAYIDNNKELITEELTTKGNNYLSITREDLMEQIGFDILSEEYGQERITAVVELMTEVFAAKDPYRKIGGQTFSAETVRQRFLQVGKEEVEYVLDCLDKQVHPIRNIRAYLETSLFNAPVTIDEYFRNLAAADIADPSRKANNNLPPGRIT
jgi:DNA-binding MarR family transcriptional regulator